MEMRTNLFHSRVKRNCKGIIPKEQKTPKSLLAFAGFGSGSALPLIFSIKPSSLLFFISPKKSSYCRGCPEPGVRSFGGREDAYHCYF
ncbi:hypothetical protein M406DRAFT_357398 [Cryphonectria parasitica EP155]|uniref:Uncharacterized protein n=1 Tax=Cryphonectria parasitica (strain ATCC 38755 / EP155) TaxID=660469 RepID=A0A9P4XXD8_CRYP1|nr:uncharacterized protein M406DRAFT_357398 [Cryphonectria parasitica EP155]KAF3762315.1 hypothetical protein M406DRAFT_357398 [Cryphonectria parasitica EP155]